MYVENVFFLYIVGNYLYVYISSKFFHIYTSVTHPYKKHNQINVKQPAIVLLNPGRSDGSLAAAPTSEFEQDNADYWKQRAVIYRMSKYP